MKNHDYYDYIFKSAAEIQESLNQEEAVAAIAVISAIVDSGIENIDPESLAGILWEFDLFAAYSDEEILETIDRLIEIAKKQGLGSLFNAANASLDDEIILDGFAAGIIMLLEPEQLIIPKNKHPYIEALQKALELETEEAEQIIGEIINIVAETDTQENQETPYQPIIIDKLGQEIYQSPWGNFRVTIPVNVDQGGRVHSEDNLVEFYNDLGKLFRIDYYPLSLEQLDHIEEQGSKKFFEEIVRDIYIHEMITANIPQAEIQYTEYVENRSFSSLNYYYIFLKMPTGSTSYQQKNNGKAININAYRGFISFIKDEYLYIISMQNTVVDGKTHGSMSEITAMMQQNILEFIATIEFTDIVILS
ncbi:hypothetical protein H6F32_04190 [Anabaena sp. FACHB-1237]|uniref:hypothetical protein n=1 Tax=Anabaena sp. FACHB-1237 TaxID=2692769 RepID=UPI0016817837|nr:hypothetical protein [Anabaena sp. FACHB-1237]MBD2136809.1 hypothetical protein [Anabaena sp. FACHB-1237]